jgi:hypothetical protein
MLYLWKGPGRMEEAELNRSQPPKLTTPAGVTQAPHEESWVCVVEGCKKRFRKAMLAAKHFNQTHTDLFEDKESWRTYVEAYKT